LFNDFDRFYGEDTLIDSLTIDDARNFVHWQLNEKTQFLKAKYRKDKKKGVSVNSVNTYLQYAKSTFSLLVEEEILNENIFISIKPIKQQKKRIETLTIEEVRTLLRAMDKSLYTDFREYVICHVLLDSFGRIDETLSVKKSEVDFEHQTVTFNKTKNGRYRIIPLSKKTLKLIAELVEETEDFYTGEYLFISTHGTKLRPDTFRKHLREIVQRTGIEKRIHPHLFRHTASRMFLDQNGSTKVLQKLLDHSDLSVTSRYAHVLDSTIEEQHRQYSPVNLIQEKRKNLKRR